MKEIFLLFIVGFFLAGTQWVLSDFAFSEELSYFVINPDIEGKPTSAIVNEKTDMVYITDFFAGKILVLDGTSNDIVKTMEVIRTPFGVGINPQTNTLFVGGEYADTLSIINATNYTTIKEISLQDPYDIAVNPNNNSIYVTSDRSNAVYVIDGKTNEIATSFEVLIPCGISVNPITGMVYVTSESENLVHVWDGNNNQMVTAIPVQESPRGVTVNTSNNMIYVTNQETNTVSVIDGSKNEVISNIEVGEIPRRIVSDSKSNIIYVSNQGSKDISVINGENNQVIKTIPVKEPFELAINSETGKLYSMYYGGELSIIAKTMIHPPPLKQFWAGIDPHEVSCKPDFVLIFKTTNFHPACVKSSSVQKLIDRDWADSHDPTHKMEMR